MRKYVVPLLAGTVAVTMLWAAFLSHDDVPPELRQRGSEEPSGLPPFAESTTTVSPSRPEGTDTPLDPEYNLKPCSLEIRIRERHDRPVWWFRVFEAGDDQAETVGIYDIPDDRSLSWTVVVEDLGVGSFVVECRSALYAAREHITLTRPGERGTLNIDMRSAPRVRRGDTVVHCDLVSDADGEPIVDDDIEYEASFAYGGRMAGTARTDGSGHAEISILFAPEGTTLSLLHDAHKPRVVALAATRRGAVDIGRVVLSSRDDCLHATVVDSGGRLVPHARLQLYDEDLKPCGSHRRIVSREDGSFELCETETDTRHADVRVQTVNGEYSTLRPIQKHGEQAIVRLDFEIWTTLIRVVGSDGNPLEGRLALRVWGPGDQWRKMNGREGRILMIGPRPEDIEEKVMITAVEPSEALGFWGHVQDLPATEDGRLATLSAWSDTRVRFVDASGQCGLVRIGWTGLELVEPRESVRSLAQTLLPMWIRDPEQGEYFVIDYPYIANGKIAARSAVGSSSVLDYESLLRSTDDEMTIVLQE